MSKLTIEQIKEVVAKMSDDFRIVKSPELSIPNSSTSGTLRGKYLCIIVGDWQDNGVEDDIEVAKSTLALATAEKLGIKCTPSDFNPPKNDQQI